MYEGFTNCFANNRHKMTTQTRAFGLELRFLQVGCCHNHFRFKDLIDFSDFAL